MFISRTYDAAGRLISGPTGPYEESEAPDPKGFDVNKLQVNQLRLRDGTLLAKIPNIENRIFFRRQEDRNNVYVELLIGRTYDKEKKQSRTQKIIIGTVSPTYPGMMIANGNYEDYFDTLGNLFNDPMKTQTTSEQGEETTQDKPTEETNPPEKPTAKTKQEEKSTKETSHKKKQAADTTSKEEQKETTQEEEQEDITQEEEQAETTRQEEHADITQEEQEETTEKPTQPTKREPTPKTLLKEAKPPQLPTNLTLPPAPGGDTRTVDEIRESLLKKEKQLNEKMEQARILKEKCLETQQELDHMIAVQTIQLQEAENDHIKLLDSMLDHYRDTVKDQAKRRPEAPMSLKQIRIINDLLSELRAYFAGCETEDYLQLAEEPDKETENPGTTYGEMALLLTAYTSTLFAYLYRTLYLKPDKQT